MADFSTRGTVEGFKIEQAIRSTSPTYTHPSQGHSSPYHPAYRTHKTREEADKLVTRFLYCDRVAYVNRLKEVQACREKFKLGILVNRPSPNTTIIARGEVVGYDLLKMHTAPGILLVNWNPLSNFSAYVAAVENDEVEVSKDQTTGAGWDEEEYSCMC